VLKLFQFIALNRMVKMGRPNRRAINDFVAENLPCAGLELLPGMVNDALPDNLEILVSIR